MEGGNISLIKENLPVEAILNDYDNSSKQSTLDSSQIENSNHTMFERMLNPAVFFQSIRGSKRKKGYNPVLCASPGYEGVVRITLHQASRDGQIEIVQQHINCIGRDKKKLNRKDQEQTTALHYAVRYGHLKIVKLLVLNGASVNVQGECGATPLHYAARYVTKPLKTPMVTPLDTPIASPLSRTKNTRTLRQILAQRRFSHAFNKKEMTPKKKALPFQKSFRNFMDLTAGKPARRCSEIPLENLKRKETIHESLVHLDNDRLVLSDPTIERPKSTLELGNMFDIHHPKHKLPEDGSFEYDYGYVGDKLESQSEKPVIIIGKLSVEDCAEVQTVDALILPEVRNVLKSDIEKCDTGTLIPSISMPDIAQNLNNDDDKSLNGRINENVVRSLVHNDGLHIHSFERSSDMICKEESILLFLLEQKANVNAKDLYGSTPLHYAAMRGNEIAARQLLSVKSVNIDAKDRTKMTALHTAASHGSYGVCALLLSAGSDLRSCDEEDMTPLHFAAMEGHLDIVELLFSHAEERGGYTLLAKMIMDQDRDEQTALHLAVENGHFDIVKLCIDKGANVNFVKTNLITPLHLACRSGQLDIVRILVESEADIESKNALQETPLHRAALFNRVNIVEFLLDRGAEIDCRDKDKETPLLMAVRKDNVEAVTLLLTRGADVTVLDSKDKTCLYVAAEEDCVNVFKILMQHPKVRCLIEEFNKNDNTPLHIAAMKGNVEIVEMLLNVSACIDAKNDQNLTPLHLAAQYGRARIVELLLEQNNNIVNDEDDASNTPLHLAALEGHMKVVEILLAGGAAVDARNAQLWTPLDCAASRGWTWCAEYLLDADSLIDPTDKVKTTPLHLASREGHIEMIKLLLSRKADITRKDHLGRNCLDWAIDNNQREAAMAILDNEHWQSALKNCTTEGNKVLTPMRKLIKKFPDVAEKVFNKCINGNGLPKDHPMYEITCTYEFLEDTFADWGPTHIYNTTQVRSPYQYYMVTSSNQVKKDKKESLISRLGDNLVLPDYVKKKSEIKRNHPLKYMVQSERTKLLSHPLVQYLLRYKWRAFGRYVYYSKLLLYIIHLMFLTGYALTIISDEYKFVCPSDTNSTSKCECKLLENSTYYKIPSVTTRLLFVDFGRYVVVLIGVVSIVIEFVKLLSELHHYFRIHSILELLTYALSIIYVLESFTWSDGSPIELMRDIRCCYLHRSLGAVTVWTSWINLVLFLRKFPKLGIYVVMFTDILKTFAQFFTVFILFIIAFGLSFHMLLYEQKPIAYATPTRAILKTSMGMLGEFEYDSVFNEDYNPVPVAWMIYVAYLVINCIILMNLLVGLAVDDIKGVQEQAGLKRLAMQVDLTLDVEKALPLAAQRNFIKMQESILPNAEKTWSVWSFWSLKSPVSASSKDLDNMELVKKQQGELKDSVRSLKHKVNELEVQNKRMEAMLSALVKHHDISVEYAQRY